MASSKSDLALNQTPFDPASITQETHAFNNFLMAKMSQGPKWYEVGAAAYRQMRAEGKTPLPAATHLDTASVSSIPSRNAGREIPCRSFKPTNGSPVLGVFMHIHGGGWVLQDEASQDVPLQEIANESKTLVISIGYRLAPEFPFPAGPEDCFDAAEWLVRHSEQEFGSSLSFIGGESAGGHLSMLTVLHLLQHTDPVFSEFKLKGSLLHFGCFDLTFTPQVFNFKKPEVLILDHDIMRHYVEAFVPGMSAERKKQADVSPLYADLERLRGKLPPTLYTCGTEDPLLDDTVFMSAKWMMAGGEAVVKIVPGAAHGYIFFMGNPASGFQEGLDATIAFMNSKLN